MDQYTTPVISIVEFESEDVITTSSSENQLEPDW